MSRDCWKRVNEDGEKEKEVYGGAGTVVLIFP